MIARNDKLLSLLEGKNKYFFIPVYQRKYSWNESNCSKLIEDLDYAIAHRLKSHFMGSVVYLEKDEAGIYSHCIIDGQQRFTTISILLIAIYNDLKKRKDENIDESGNEIVSTEGIRNSYFYLDPYKANPTARLILTDEDQIDYCLLLEGKEVNKESNIGKNYFYFSDNIKSRSLANIKELYDAISSLEIVNVSLDYNDDPQRIFEDINSKACPLEEADMIRNFVLMGFDYETQKKYYKEYWSRIEKNVKSVGKLIKCYLAIKTNNYFPDKQLYNAFKGYVIERKVDVVDLIKDIYKYSEYMKDMENYTADSKLEYQKSIYRLNKLDMTTIYPLVFVCVDAFKTGDIVLEDLSYILSIIESYITRRQFLKLPTASLNKIFAFFPAEMIEYQNNGKTFLDAFKCVICSKSGNTRFPRDNEFIDAFGTFELYNAKHPFIKYVLSLLETFEHKEIVDVEKDINNGKLTIEHVMPQTLSEEWEKALGVNHEEIHQKYVNTIGNLTLTAYNSEYSNESFATKRDLPEKGFVYSSLILNDYIKKQSKWTETEIKERAKILLERALKIWKYPKVDLSPYEFDKPETWCSIRITKFARDAFEYMFDNGLLSDEEIEDLKDKTKSKLMLGAYYPVISDSRIYDGGKTHWNSTPYKYHGKDIYLSYEWFEEQYEKLVNFVKGKVL